MKIARITEGCSLSGRKRANQSGKIVGMQNESFSIALSILLKENLAKNFVKIYREISLSTRCVNRTVNFEIYITITITNNRV